MNQKLILILVGVGLLSIGVGFLVGFFTSRATQSKSDDSDANYYKKLIQDEDRSFFEKIEKNVDPEKIRAHLKHMTSIPHMAGTPGDKISADYLYDQWKSQGLDNVEFSTYDVFLDFPDDEKFNSVEVRKSDGQIETTYKIEEITYDKELNYSGIPKPFLAYAARGVASFDEVYYVNYCREEDFLFLIQKNYNITNKLVICRYGQLFRGNKIQFAQKYGAKGVLLFDDPLRSAPPVHTNYIYPNGEFLPKEGVQRGTLLIGNGDPTTPNYPSTDYSYRLQNPTNLPTIQAQCIGYSVALEIFKLMDASVEVIPEWKGEMNVKYTYGGKLKEDRSVTLNVFNQRKLATTYNVMGVIEGYLEPDRYVMIGNHRDSWSFGSVDPTSGTSAMLEVSRVLSHLKNKEKWRPKRSIMFLSWGSEEYGLIGSVEWVEEYKKKLISNSVAYINLDTIISGNYSYQATSSPLFYDLIFDVVKSVKIPTGQTMMDRWIENNPDSQDKSKPSINPYLGSGSDYMGFSQRLGVPCIDQTFLKDRRDQVFKNIEWSTYPTYHSSYETFNLIEKYIDPKFEVFRQVAVVTSELTRRLSESLILPLNVKRYPVEIQKELESFERKNGDELNKLSISLDGLRASIKNLTQVTNQFQERLDKINKKEYHIVRVYNEILRNFERGFLDASGIARAGYEHMIFSPSLANSYGTDPFPSISDAIYNYKANPTSKDLIENIKLQISIVTYAIQSAASILKDPIKFNRYI